ncbi:RBBP9/YdeN family alpha/beta hydrolase [Marinospirillum perlucidum]|uniref:RBBP9/YdeN family alpha/beta hydrolase n=1 Tax=Marinospirillum perlucidum TaxID=1982602 RepID=UPI000DF2AE52|nr:alpha/beta hydrolase [Marinospirillum perlucidum]
MSISYLILPGWHGSGQDHWQTHWQQTLPHSQRLQVQSWEQPNPDDWRQALETTLQSADQPLVLIAHSLGCINLANWAAQAHPQLLKKVAAALLVAPADVERHGCPAELTPFAPIARQALPFPTLVLGSDNDPAATSARIEELASDWQADVRILGKVGHINTASGHTHWEEGKSWLELLLKSTANKRKAA